MEAKADERTNGKSVKIVQKVSKNKEKEFSYKMTVIRQRQEHATQTGIEKGTTLGPFVVNKITKKKKEKKMFHTEL
jgi:hypothetical protein